MTQIAWMPGNRPEMADALAVQLAPSPDLTLDFYLACLAIRVQRLVDRAADPAAAVAALAQTMALSGSFSGMTVPRDEAGSILVYSNPALVDRLRLDGILPAGYRLPATSAKVPAAMALQADRSQPAARRLAVIGSLLGRPI
jgi:hypothetical protein